MWYKRNFEREEEIKQGVEASIADMFGEKEWRIYDIWVNDTSPNKSKKTSFLKDSLNKMTENLSNMEGLNKDIKKISSTLLNVKVGKASIV